jgi:UDP-2,3-diacylglucosamine hydrolase
MKTLILADVHLKVNDAGAQTRHEFTRFLREIDPSEIERIIILGDLFDFWFEYKQVIFSGYFDVLCALHDLERAGVKLDLICGNHDFWAGRFLRDHLKIAIHPDKFQLTLGDQRVLFVHGDGINPKDWRYRAYKAFARFSWVVGAFRQIHPDWAMKIAQGVSHGSRTLLAPDDPSDSDEVRAIRSFAEEELKKGEADVMICGHSHFPEECTFEKGLYFNTGDWLEKRTYLIWENGVFSRDFHEDMS